MAPKSVADVYEFAWGFRNLECWIVWDKPVNKSFCVCPALSVKNLSVLGRQSPLEGSSTLPSQSLHISWGKLVATWAKSCPRPPGEKQQWCLPDATLCAGIAPCLENMRKGLCSAILGEQLEGQIAAAVIEYDQKQNFPVPASLLELTLQCPRMLLQSRDDSQRKEPPSLLPGQMQHCGRNRTPVPVLLPTEVGHYTSRRNAQQLLH